MTAILFRPKVIRCAYIFWGGELFGRFMKFSCTILVGEKFPWGRKNSKCPSLVLESGWRLSNVPSISHHQFFYRNRRRSSSQVKDSRGPFWVYARSTRELFTCQYWRTSVKFSENFKKKFITKGHIFIKDSGGCSCKFGPTLIFFNLSILDQIFFKP